MRAKRSFRVRGEERSDGRARLPLSSSLALLFSAPRLFPLICPALFCCAPPRNRNPPPNPTQSSNRSYGSRESPMLRNSAKKRAKGRSASPFEGAQGEGGSSPAPEGKASSSALSSSSSSTATAAAAVAAAAVGSGSAAVSRTLVVCARSRAPGVKREHAAVEWMNLVLLNVFVLDLDLSIFSLALFRPLFSALISFLILKPPPSLDLFSLPPSTSSLFLPPPTHLTPQQHAFSLEKALLAVSLSSDASENLRDSFDDIEEEISRVKKLFSGTGLRADGRLHNSFFAKAVAGGDGGDGGVVTQ